MSWKGNIVPFTIITPTGDRPEPFALCCRYVLRQTVLPTEWIIVDDGVVSTIPPQVPFVKYIRRVRKQIDGEHTLPAQMAVALGQVTTERIIIIEDDDWYHPSYCEHMMGLLDKHATALIVGQGQSIYYHIPYRKCYDVGNKQHASWCQTGFRSIFIANVLAECTQSKAPFIDVHLWRSTKQKFLLQDQPPLCIGIKGLPGRACVTIGHKGMHPLFKPDPKGIRLYELIGADALLYEKFQGVCQTTPTQEKSTVGHAGGLESHDKGCIEGEFQ